MTSSCKWAIRAVAAVVALLCLAAPSLAEEVYYIRIDQAFLRKIPLAVPDFIPAGQDAASAQTAAQAREWISSGLDFTRFFQMLDPATFLVREKEGLTSNAINFANWAGIGAELLITGGVKVQNGVIEAELRLFDVSLNRLIVGKRYKGQMEDLRKITRRFCMEVVYALTGTKGIFGTQIAFVSTTPGNKEIYSCEFDGFDPQQLTSGSRIALSPAWSADGQYLAYVSYADGGAHIFCRNLKQKRGIKIAYNGINITPAWDPGRFALAATLSLNGDQEIYSLTGNGKIIKKLTDNWGIDAAPSYSPDGKKMAFMSDRSGSPQIYLLDLETGFVNRVTFSGRYNADPAFSPKGDRIAYAGMDNGDFDIFTVGIDGSDVAKLTDSPGNDETPAWSPDGTLIAFGSTREGTSRIYVMTAHGTDQRRLLRLEGAQTDPAWSPRLGDY